MPFGCVRIPTSLPFITIFRRKSIKARQVAGPFSFVKGLSKHPIYPYIDAFIRWLDRKSVV